MCDDEKVGYGKPPKASQFKPGESGNPKGRPPNKKREPVDVIALLDGEVKVRVKGREKTMPAFEASLRQLVKRAMNRDMRAIGTFIKLTERYGAFQEAAPNLGGVLTAPKGVTPEEWISGKTPDDRDHKQGSTTKNGTSDREGRPREGGQT